MITSFSFAFSIKFQLTKIFMGQSYQSRETKGGGNRQQCLWSEIISLTDRFVYKSES